MILFHDFFGFLFDTLFAYLYLKEAEGKDDPSIPKKALGICFLLVTFIFYRTNLIPTIFVFVYRNFGRLFLRILFYTLFLILYKGSDFKLAVFSSGLWTSVYTLCHNIFLTPLTRPFLMGEAKLSGYPLIDQILCILIVYGTKAFFYMLMQHFVSLNNIFRVEGTDAIVLIIILSLSLYIKRVQQLVNDNSFSFRISTMLSTYFIILQIVLLIFLILFERYQKKNRENMILSLQDISVKALLENSRQMRENEESLKAFRHDIKNHSFALQALIQQNDIEGAKKYLSKMNESLQDVNKTYSTGNKLFDALLKQKLAKLEKQDIDIQVDVNFQNTGFIDHYDLCVIVGNTLDNAIEALAQMEASQKRYIRIKGTTSAGQLIYMIENSCSASSSSGFKTTKSDSSLHGYGLRNVKKAVTKYKGEVNIYKEENRFRLTIIIPIPDQYC